MEHGLYRLPVNRDQVDLKNNMKHDASSHIKFDKSNSGFDNVMYLNSLLLTCHYLLIQIQYFSFADPDI